MFGFMGKILIVDLTSKKHEVLEKDEPYYKKFLGGSLLCARLFDEQTKESAQLTPFSEQNVVVFATGIFAGNKIGGSTRVNVLTLSPETPGLYLSQAGGEFGPDLKRAGYDALVIKGRSQAPVILKIDNDTITFIDAGELWGKDRFALTEHLNRMNKQKYSIASIGPAGENLACQANIMFEKDHYAGRGGLGAVLGAKQLKAVCVRGDQKVLFKDTTLIRKINQKGVETFTTSFKKNPDSFLGVLRNYGTFGLLEMNQAGGNLPTRNFNMACMKSKDAQKEISHQEIKKNLVGRQAPCKGCYISCKKRKKSGPADEPLSEYESIALLGPNIGLENNISEGIKICELCNRLGLDTISTGSTIAFLMDCFENNVLSQDETGFSISFGETDKIIDLVENIAYQKDEMGKLLAGGINGVCEKFGDKVKPHLRFSKGIGLPAHMPRKKPGLGFAYLHGPNPADHMKLEHDWIASDPESLKAFNLKIRSTAGALDIEKAEILARTQIYFSAMDALSVCLFVFGPGNIFSFDDITTMVNAATGFDYRFDDLMNIGERSIHLQKKLSFSYGANDEDLHPYMEKEIPEGPSKGSRIDKKDFEKARKHLYSFWGWNEKGRPQKDVLDKFGI